MVYSIFEDCYHKIIRDQSLKFIWSSQLKLTLVLLRDLQRLEQIMRKMETDDKGKWKEIQQIRSTGYELTTPLTVAMPTYQQSSSFFASLFNLVGNNTSEKNIFNPNAIKEATILSDKKFLVVQSNKFAFFNYCIVDDRIEIESEGCLLMGSQIERMICTSTRWLSKNENMSYVLLLLQSSTVVLISIDEQKLPVQLSDVKLHKKVLAFRFVSQKDVIVVLSTGRIIFYSIKNNKLHENTSLDIKVKDKDVIKSCDICVLRHQPSKVFIFFTTLAQKQKRSALNLVQLEKSRQQLSFNRSFQDIFESPVPQALLTSLTITSFQNSFLVQQNNNIWILQYKFGRYVRADAVSDLKQVLKLFVIDRQNHLFLCSFGEKEIELWELTIKDVGCRCSLLDVIEADGHALAPKMLVPWIFRGGNNKTELAFLADLDQRDLNIFLTRKSDKMHKLIEKVRVYETNKGTGKYAQSQFKARVHQIQELGERLGFERRDLYLNLWQKNQKNSAHIFQYLLPCQDFKVIFKQLEQYMREKLLSISELVKILKKIQSNILLELRKRLDIQLLRQYLKANFQRRKLKLYTSELRLDFQKYHSIFQMSLIDFVRHSIDLRLFPEKFYHDIVWKEQHVETPLEIHYILREFRLVILEDYPGFLFKLLEPYMDCLPKVLESYYYLLPQYPLKISIIRQQLVKLSNIYPSQRIEESQHFWLGYISEYEWRQEESSVHYLFNLLFQHYDTSYINDKIKQFCNSKIVILERNQKYVLLETERAEFQKELPKISEATSILYLCENINRRALARSEESENEEILRIMMNNNHLPQEEFNTFVRLSKLQMFLIRQQLVSSETTILELMSMSDVQIVRVFFLGERAQVRLLFEVVSKLYLSQIEFTRIIGEFVGSAECSKVELEIFVRYIYYMSEEEISQNMQILEIIIKGYLSRIQIRQIDKATDFLSLFRELPLSGSLLKKLSAFESVKNSCYPVLRELGLGKLSYQAVITDIDTVVQTLVGNYFSNFYGQDLSLYIQGREILMMYPSNLFVIILYFKDKIYSFREEVQTFLSFGYALVTWNQFGLIRQCFGSGLIIDDEDITAQQFYLILVQHVLTRYLSGQEMVYDQQTKQHLSKLLSLVDDEEPLKIVEEAKIQFAGLLEELDFKLTLQYMQTIKEEWGQGKESRTTIFKEIIDNFGEEVTFDTFKEMHRLLEVIRLGKKSVEGKSQEMEELTHHICRNLFSQQKYLQICEIISFWNKGSPSFMADFSIMTECFLKVLSSYEASCEIDLEVSIQTIDFYLTYYHQVGTINNLFGSKFKDVDLEEAKHCRSIELDPEILNRTDEVLLSRDQLWTVILSTLRSPERSIPDVSKISIRTTNKASRVEKKEISAKDLLFVYFFICKMYESSSFLFDLQDISFNHQKNIAVLDVMSRSDKYSHINFIMVASRYMKGLFKIYYRSTTAQLNKAGGSGEQLSKEVQEMQDQVKHIEQFDNNQLLVLISEIKRDSQNQAIYFSMRRLASLFKSLQRKEMEEIGKKIVEMGGEGRNSKTQKELKSVKFIEKIERPLNVSITHFDPEQSYHRKVYRFSQFQKIKNKYLTKSNITSEKKLVEKVFGDLEEDNLEIDNYQDMAADLQFFSRKFQQSDRGSRVDLELESVLCDLKSQDEIAQNDTIMAELYSIEGLECGQQDYKDLQVLFAGKNYEVIKEKYDKGVIIKAIMEYFYTSIEANRVVKEISDMFKPKRLKRALTYHNPLNEQESKIMILLEALKNLQLASNLSKIKYLRQSLTLLSSLQLFTLERHILTVFKLNVLLDPSKNPKKIIKSLLINMEGCQDLPLDHFEKVLTVVDFFVCKCYEERKKTQPISLKREEEEPNHLAQMYLIYLKKLVTWSRSQTEMAEQTAKIMKNLGRQKLAQIHDDILKVFQPTEQLKHHYVLSIHQIFASAAAS